MTPNGEKAARDAALSQVAGNAGDWMARAVDVAVSVLPTRPFIGEDLRPLVTAVIGPPHHPNAWGALTRILLDRKQIVPTGTWRAMRARGSHARQSPEYRRWDWFEDMFR